MNTIMQKSANTCVKCAKCVPDCTIYSVNRDEITSPRGYLDIIQAYAQGRLSMDLSLKNAIESCFLCTTCVTNCPFNLPIDFVIQRARADIAKIYGIPLYKKIMFFMLGNRKILNFIFKIGFFFSPCIAKKDKNVSVLRFKLPKIGKRTIMPLNPTSFLKKYKEDIIPQNSNKKKIGIFIGCLSNYNFLGVGDSLVKILTTLHYEVKILKKQECCGAPAFFSGDIKNTTRLIKKNLDYFISNFELVEAILIPEATCSSMVLIDWEHALEIESEMSNIDNTKYKNMLQKLKTKVFMASEWLEKYTNLKDILKTPAEKLNITYHDPCHAKKTLNIFREPRVLLSKHNLIEMNDCSVCCGFGGVSIQGEKYHLAKSVGDRKAANIKNSGASFVSAECSACRVQIQDSLYRNNISDIDFIHPLEVIANNL